MITAFICTDCGHVYDAPDHVHVSDSWTDWACPQCGKVIGGYSDQGALDLGIVDEAPDYRAIVDELVDRNLPHPETVPEWKRKLMAQILAAADTGEPLVLLQPRVRH